MLRFAWVVLCLLPLSLNAAAPSRAVEIELDQMRHQAHEQGWTFSVDYHPVLDMSLQEATGYRKTPGGDRNGTFSTPAKLRSIPAAFDWRDQVSGGLPPIKNQGNCGSCWAFGTVGALESAIKIKDGVNKNLSEQQLVSCNHNGWSCGGGDFAHAIHQNPGAALGADFPYTASDERCKSNLKYDSKIESWSYVGSSRTRASVDEIKSAIQQYGPVAVTVEATRSFEAYKSGIYNACDGNGNTNHIVDIVGWNDNGGYWIMRNSWGSKWGEQGYMRIKYDCNSIADEATFVVYKPACKPQPQVLPGTDKTIHAGESVMLGDMPLMDTT
jgi:C1A family cysteine protease